MVGIIIAAILVVIILLVLVFSIKVVNTGYIYILERFGQFYKILEPGWHITIPFVDYVRKKI
ncbi:MAG: SPFH domain-containing protein, partial [Sarcina sp.]